MRKIPTVFIRDFSETSKGRYVTREQNPDCAWVFAGEGTSTRKYDGTCVMFDGERWWARREVKPGKKAPAGFVEVQFDLATEKTVGWEPIEQSAFAKFHAEAVTNAGAPGMPWTAGTYELIGPKINGNHEGCGKHLLVFHGEGALAACVQRLVDVPRDFGGLADWLRAHPFEGVVWHHPDGRMAKIKTRDFDAGCEVAS